MEFIHNNLYPRATFLPKQQETESKTVEKAPEKDLAEIIASTYAEEEEEPEEEGEEKEYSFGSIVEWGEIDPTPIIDNLVKVMIEMTGVKLYPYQLTFARRVIESVVLNDGDEITALYSRQSGKSETIANVVVVLMVMLPLLATHFKQLELYKNGFFVGLFAPIDAQSKIIGDRVNARLSGEITQEFLNDPDLNIVYTSLKLSNGSFAKIHTAAPQSKIEGHSYHLIVVDEAQHVVEEKMVRSIHPQAAAFNGTIAKMGTPTDQNCEFYEAIKRNLALISTSKKRNHFEFNYKTVQKYNKRYGIFVKKEIERYGIDNDYFRMSYGLEWLLDQGMCITEKEFQKRMRVPHGLENMRIDGALYVAGLDLGKKQDSTVLTILKLQKRTNDEFVKLLDSIAKEEKEDLHFIQEDLKSVTEADYYVKEVVQWYEYHKDNWQAQIINLSSVIKDHGGILTVAVDATGTGDMPYETLNSRLNYTETEVIPVQFSQKMNHTLAQIFYKNLNHKAVKIPSGQGAKTSRRWKKFHSQLLSAIKVWKNNYMQITHPQVKGAKDDYVQSLLLALYAAEYYLNSGNIHISRNMFFSGGGGEETTQIDDIIQTAKFSTGEKEDNMSISDIRKALHNQTLNVAQFSK